MSEMNWEQALSLEHWQLGGTDRLTGKETDTVVGGGTHKVM